jgi:hypothetical protein
LATIASRRRAMAARAYARKYAARRIVMLL